MIVRPLAISARVRAALPAGAPVVVAAHRLGASLRVPGTDDAVFLSARGSGLLPAHVVVRARDRDRVLRAFGLGGPAAGVRGDPLVLHLDVRGVRTFRCTLAAIAVDLERTRAGVNVAAVAHWLRTGNVRLGLGTTAAELLAPQASWLKHLVTALQRDGGSAVAALRSVIGHGAGATPAGDDLVLGALAHGWATRGGGAPIVSGARSLEAELPVLTTAVGATYLRAGARGEFGSHLVAWVRALPRVSPSRALALARRVAAHGATSGYDTLVGFVAAAELADASRVR